MIIFLYSEKIKVKLMDPKNVDELIYQPLGLKYSNVEEEDECGEYSGFNFTLNHLKIKFRTSKITPTKTGQFVTIWKRDAKGETAPFDSRDPFDFYLISASKDNDKGIFIFPKDILIEKGIVSHEKKTGKRGIRVYPGWDLTESKQAKATQKWQTEYFIDLSQNKESYLQKAKALLDLK
ncbi:hypothetical protein IW16_14565 [Chryseobacterium vrystaatense]|uniref:MepB protein n=2 Tax=Chryseobacterium vrystaatense TaxID=307480 RepID=A0ABR4UMN1_9FLAO|nr:hypothetical protein IW16_14565 [Chryseobacterium vrystaatense]